MEVWNLWENSIGGTSEEWLSYWEPFGGDNFGPNDHEPGEVPQTERQKCERFIEHYEIQERLKNYESLGMEE
jgi:hypothetical protein